MYKQKKVTNDVGRWLFELGYFDDTFALHNLTAKDLYYKDSEFDDERYIRLYDKQSEQFVIGVPYPTYTDVMLWLSEIGTTKIKFDIENCSFKIDGEEFRVKNIPSKLEHRIEFIIENICRRRLVSTPKLDVVDRAEKMADEVYGTPIKGTDKWFEKEGFKKAIVKHLFNI